MNWESKLKLWENDPVCPMTHKQIDTAYAIDRLETGRKFLKESKWDVKGKRVLDVAMGAGGILCAFAEQGAKCYGLDVHDYFLQITMARFRDMRLKPMELSLWEGAGNKIPFADGTFDYVICTDVLHHAPNWKHFVKEISRVMKDGGRIFISEERRWFPTYILKSPHDNLPLTVLMPKKLRDHIDSLIKKPSVQHHMFSFSFEITQEFKKHDILLKEFHFLKADAFKSSWFPDWLWPFYNLMFMQYRGVKV